MNDERGQHAVDAFRRAVVVDKAGSVDGVRGPQLCVRLRDAGLHRIQHGLIGQGAVLAGTDGRQALDLRLGVRVLGEPQLQQVVARAGDAADGQVLALAAVEHESRLRRGCGGAVAACAALSYRGLRAVQPSNQKMMRSAPSVCSSRNSLTKSASRNSR